MVKKVGEKKTPLGEKETPLGEKVTKVGEKVNFVGEKKIHRYDKGANEEPSILTPNPSLFRAAFQAFEVTSPHS